MANSTISYLWRDPKAAKEFRTGVSLHSHTNQSKETLDFLANLGNQYSWHHPASALPFPSSAVFEGPAWRSHRLRRPATGPRP